jgi:tetratricopeptide (TPR) repeat protein
MRLMTCTVRMAGVVLCALTIGVGPAHGQGAPAPKKIPVTTSSEEARKLYLQARDLAEKLRAVDANRLYKEAATKDPGLALAHVGVANTSGTTKEFLEATARAVALADRVSEGERRIILALDAGAKGEPATVLSHYIELVRLFPDDERAHNLLGNAYFGRQDYEKAIAAFTKATAINPSFSQPYNQLGYAYRFQDQYTESENAFKKYVELIPNDPNPYDSYAELLMKMGRFDESIKMYEKALAIDPNFSASYVGIGNDQLFMDRHDAARATFAKLEKIARSTGERRQAKIWAAATYVHENATDKAIAEIRAAYTLAETAGDLATMSGDLTLIGDVLREAGRLDEALAKYTEAVTTINKASVPAEVKDATRRNHLFEEARVAVARNDLAVARSKTAAYAKEIGLKNRPFEVRQLHELEGSIALADKQFAKAEQELKQANQQDPRILYLMAVAAKGAGDSARAATLAAKAAKFNSLNFNYAFVRSKARTIGS